MIDAENYRLIYYSSIVLMALLYSIRSCNIESHKGKIPQFYRSQLYGVQMILVLGLIFFIGLRPISKLFTDTPAYVEEYRTGLMEMKTYEYMWNFFFYLFRSLDISVHFWFTFIAYIYIGCIWITCKNLYKSEMWYSFLLFISTFFFFGYGVNVLRAGVASSVLLCGISYLLRYKGCKKAWGMYFLTSLMAFGIHNASIISALCIFGGFLFKSTKIAILLWLSCFLSSLFIPMEYANLFVGFTNIQDRMAYYVSTESSVHPGFRWDFVAYSIAPVLFAIYVKKKYIIDVYYNYLINGYLFANSLWLLIIKVNYSDRFAYLSWFMYALLFSYPLIRYKMGNGIKSIILLGFVIFACIIHA